MGQWNGTKMHGKGVYKFKDGSYYEGQYNMDKREDIAGRMVWKTPKNAEYIGGWKNDKRSGMGIFKTENFTYTGMFVKDEMTGLCSVVFKSGAVYEGIFEKGKPHGSGTMIEDRAETKVYRGEWKKGVKDGLGEFTVKDFANERTESYAGFF